MVAKIERTLAFTERVRKKATVKISSLEGLKKAQNRSLNGVTLTAIDPISQQIQTNKPTPHRPTVVTKGKEPSTRASSFLQRVIVHNKFDYEE